jgi:high affinity Mn2+ porin
MEAAMAMLAHILSTTFTRTATRAALLASTAAIAVAFAGSAKADDAFVTKAPAIPAIPFINPFINGLSGPAYNWNGFYAGGHFGYAWGNSNFTASSPGAPDVSGSFSVAQQINSFNEAGSWLLGLQAGYNYVLPNRLLLGAEVDATFPSFQNLAGLSTGNFRNFTSPTLGAETFGENLLSSGTIRGRIGYAPGSWLFYATGGFAWTYNQQTLTQAATGNTSSPFVWRLGWAAGAGVEVPLIPHWTARLEYLFTDYGKTTSTFSGGAQTISSDWTVQELRAGVNYQFGYGATAANAPLVTKAPAAPDQDNINFHGEMTFVWQGYPAFHAAFTGPFSLPPVATARETTDMILFAGLRLWQGAELWADPEIDQGHGLADSHGVAGFLNGNAYKLGFDYPYARINRYFFRQTIDLGGESEKVDADLNQFAQSQTANRLVLTVGKFYIIDIFDTNKYANNPKSDFLNWSVINAGTFDFGSDAWSDTYGAAAEWYQGNWAVRGGVFDMAQTPAGGGGNSALAYGDNPSTNQYELIGEIENRYALWGQPGKIKVTGFLIRGNMGSYSDALAFAAATGTDASDALAAVRVLQSRPGVSLNLEQQVSETIGVFARAGWADGNVEPWNNTDIDRTAEVGASFNGKPWNRPDDTVGIAGVVNGISSAHIAYLNAGGLGIVIGDGALPNPGLEQIIETYYSYALTPSTKVSFDYQLVVNPAYNTDRGPVNVFAGRFHTQF